MHHRRAVSPIQLVASRCVQACALCFAALAAAVVPTRSAENETLTKRENEVLVLMAEGLSNKEIAGKLTISEHTAKFHVNSILQKMDAQKRVEAVVRAARRGLINL